MASPSELIDVDLSALSPGGVPPCALSLLLGGPIRLLDIWRQVHESS
jgi:hypothetical protein